MPLRFNDRQGTSNNDSTTIFSGEGYFGFAGNDTITAGSNSIDALAMGGRGNDTYVLSGTNIELLVYERGRSSNDVVVAPLIRMQSSGTVAQGDSFYAVIDGRHLYMLGNYTTFNPLSTQGVLILDWKSNAIESFQLGNGTFSVADIDSYLVSGNVHFLGNLTIDQMRAQYGFPYSSAEINEALTYYAGLDVINRASVVTPAAAHQSVNSGGAVLASSLFSVSDLDGDASDAYQFWDSSDGGGHFVLNGSIQGVRQNIDVSPSQLGGLQWVTAPGQAIDSVWVRVYDGYDWSEWTNWEMESHRITNLGAPTISGPSVRSSEVSQWHQLSTFLNVSDADGDLPVSFTITDNSSASDGAYLWANGAPLAQGATVTVNASDLSGIWVRGGTFMGHNTFTLHADDGYANGVGADFTFDLHTRMFRAPTVTPTAATQGVDIGSTVSAASLFGYGDLDGDAATAYQFWDSGAGGGFFRVGSSAKGSGVAIDVTLAELSSTVYVAGNVQGSETLWVRANDGFGWSDWKSWTQQTQRTTNVGAPTISGPATRVSEMNQWHQLSTFLSVSDADGDLPISFTITDNSSAAGGAYLWANGAPLAQGATVTVNASDLSGIWVRGGTFTGHDTFTLHADDGYANGVGADFTFDLNTRLPNNAPVVTSRAAVQSAGINQSIAVQSLFTWNDADVQAATQFQLWDGGANGGYFQVNSSAKGSGIAIDVQAVDLQNTVYVGGATSGSETLWVRASDGESWGEWVSWTMATQASPVNQAPAIDPSGAPAVAQHTYGVNRFFSAWDPDGNVSTRWTLVTSYEFTDLGAGGGTLYLNGVAQAAGTTVTVSSANLSTVTYLAGNAGETDTLRIRASDGTDWSAPLDRVIPFGENSAPSITAHGATVRSPVTVDGTPGRVRLDTLLDSYTDANFDPVAFYQFTDGSASGTFVVNGVAQAQNSTITLTQSQLATAYYVASAGSSLETVSIRANDGFGWGAPVSVTLQTAPNVRPGVISQGTVTVAPETHLTMNMLFSALDPETSTGPQVGVGVVALDIRAPTAMGSAFGSTNGTSLFDANTREWRIPNLADFGILTSAQSDYVVSARAFDGVDWSEWATVTVHVEAPADTAPNTLATARVLTLTPSVQTIQEWVGVVDQYDYYKFTLTETDYVDIGLSGVSFGGNIGLSVLYESTGTPVAGGGLGFGIHNLPVNRHLMLGAGDYIVAVNQTAGGHYTLSLSNQEVPPDEAGNTLAAARAVTLSGTTQTFTDDVGSADTVDYYTFTLGGNSPFTMELAAIANGAQMRYDLYKSNGAGGHGTSLLTVEVSGNGSATPVFNLVDTPPGSTWYFNSLVGGNTALSVDLDGGTYYLAATPLNGTNTSYSVGLSNVIPPPGGGGTPGGNIVATGALTAGSPLVFNSAVLQGSAQTIHTFSIGSLNHLDLGVTVANPGATVQLSLFTVNGNGQLGAQIQGAIQSNGNQITLQSSGALSSGNYALVVTGSQATNYNLTLTGS